MEAISRAECDGVCLDELSNVLYATLGGAAAGAFIWLFIAWYAKRL
jgi:hypothetical protein